MTSPESVLGLVAEAKGNLLALLQDSDHDGNEWSYWSEEMFEAVELLTRSMQHIDRARLYQ